MALLVKTNGEQINVIPKNNKSFSLEELQFFVGGFIELFRTENKIFVLNEEGLNLELPKNEVATSLLYKEVNLKTIQFLVGDIVICDENEID